MSSKPNFFQGADGDGGGIPSMSTLLLQAQTKFVPVEANDCLL